MESKREATREQFILMLLLALFKNVCGVRHNQRSSGPASISVAGIFLPAAVADIRFRTPVECINVPPASLK